MIKNFFTTNRQGGLKRGFSMIELAIFITVVSFILVSFALSISSDVENNKLALTKKRIDKIYNALGVYVAQNGNMPCPGAINNVVSNVTYGDEGSCLAGSGYFISGNLVYGMVPIKELGLSLKDSVDGFGSKFVYVMDKRFAEADPFSSYDGTITVQNIINGSSSIVTTEAVFILMSYGKNKSGAFNMNSATQISDALNDTDEIDNESASFDNDFVAFSDRPLGTFDDVVFYRENKTDFLQDFDIYNLIETNRTESNE